MIDAFEQPGSLQILVLVRTDEGPRTHNQSVFMSTHFYNCILFFLPKKLPDADCCTINYEQDISPSPPSLLFCPGAENRNSITAGNKLQMVLLVLLAPQTSPPPLLSLKCPVFMGIQKAMTAAPYFCLAEGKSSRDH